MSFIKITIKEQRDALAKEMHALKQNIKANSMRDRLEKQRITRDLTKFFKPVVEAQEKAATQITRKIDDILLAPPALLPHYLPSLPIHHCPSL